MRAKIQKWGNSLGVRIPGHMAKDLSIENGSVVEISEENKKIIISPKKNYKLSDIIGQINKNNIHSDQFDISAGKEHL